LADSLDATGWKRKNLNRYPYIAEMQKALRDKVNAARSQFGVLSDVYQQAKQELKDFNNEGEHILVASRQIGDIKETFRLHQILTPTAIRNAERIITTLQRDSRYQSTDPNIRGPLVSEIIAYQALIKETYSARKKINSLLQSMSLEPILDWDTLTLSKIKTQLTKLEKKLAQTETEVKRTPIKSQYTRLQVKVPNKPNQPAIQLSVEENLPLIQETMRLLLDKMGLAKTDLVIIENIIANMKEGKAGGMFSKNNYMPLGLIQIAFDLDEYNLINQRLTRDKYSHPDHRKNDIIEKNVMVWSMIDTLHHEGVHALYRLGMFTEAEWTLLKKEATKTWIKEFNIKEKYPKGNIYS